MLPNAQIKAASPAVKILVGHSNGNGAGNGTGVVSGRGLAHRPVADRLVIAADLALGVKRLDPSLGQIADACRVTPAQLREAIWRRANGSDVEAAKLHLRSVVEEFGLSNTMDLLSEIEDEQRVK
jgi:hypothetical protein